MVAPYTVQDFLSEMVEPRNGAHHMGPLDLPHVPQLPSVDDRVILIAHSAGGWMSRIYLSEARCEAMVELNPWNGFGKSPLTTVELSESMQIAPL